MSFPTPRTFLKLPFGLKKFIGFSCPLAFNGQIFWGHELEGLGQVLGGSLLSKKEPVGIRIRYMRTFDQ